MQVQEGLHPLFVPLVVGCASLIAFLSIRNANIAERIRESNKDIMVTKKGGEPFPEGRVENLVLQVTAFRSRYRRNSRALSLAVIALALFVIMVVLDVWRTTPWDKTGAPFVFLVVGVAVLAAGLFLTLYEIEESHITLNADIHFALRHAASQRKAESLPSPQSPNAGPSQPPAEGLERQGSE